MSPSVRRALPEQAVNVLSNMANYTERDLMDFMREKYHETFDPSGRTADTSQMAVELADAALNPVFTLARFVADPLVLNPTALRMAGEDFQSRNREARSVNDVWDLYAKEQRESTQRLINYISDIKTIAKRQGRTISDSEMKQLISNFRTGEVVSRRDNFAFRPQWSGSQPQPTSAGYLHMAPREDIAWRRPSLFGDPLQFNRFRTLNEGSNWFEKEQAIRQVNLQNLGQNGNNKTYRLTGGF